MGGHKGPAHTRGVGCVSSISPDGQSIQSTHGHDVTHTSTTQGTDISTHTHTGTKFTQRQGQSTSFNRRLGAQPGRRGGPKGAHRGGDRGRQLCAVWLLS